MRLSEFLDHRWPSCLCVSFLEYLVMQEITISQHVLAECSHKYCLSPVFPVSIFFAGFVFLVGWSGLTGMISGPRDLFFLTFNPDFIGHCSNFSILNMITFPTLIQRNKNSSNSKNLFCPRALLLFTWIPCMWALRRVAMDKTCQNNHFLLYFHLGF